MADIELNKLIGNNTYKIMILPPLSGGKNITDVKVINGFLTNQISWSAQNQWEGLHSGMAFMKGEVGENIQKGEAVANQAGVDTGAQHAIGGITETIARWQGATKPSFGFNVMFISLDAAMAKRNLSYVKALLKGCTPSSHSGEGWAKGTMEAPYGYKTGFTGSMDDTVPDDQVTQWDDQSSTEGTWRVQVGKWFNAPKLVLSSCNVNFSQQCTPSGAPLFIECQLVFETWRLPKADEIDLFFNI